MFGNVMNNKQIRDALQSGTLRIDPFDGDKLKTIHYPLTAEKILTRESETPDGEYRLGVLRDFDVNQSKFTLKPRQYILAEINEFIKIKENIVGHFIASSNLITKGISLHAGRIEAPFGDYEGRRQKVRFGLQNCRDCDVELGPDDVIAYVYFFDIRGLDNIGIKMSLKEQREFRLWQNRLQIVADDGPNYGDGS